MTQQMRITRFEKERFDEVCRHYGCTDDEIAEIKIAARVDPQAWRDAYGAMWSDIQQPVGRVGDPAIYATRGAEVRSQDSA